MSEVLTPDNVVELIKILGAAAAGTIVGIYGIRAQADSGSHALDVQADLVKAQGISNDRIGDAIEKLDDTISELRVTQEKLCEKIGKLD